ncbi:MAG TPA: hypothetical protein VLI90_13225 [Tepidisphaeraceae bacterium]|nr:hypothetical protein [Tepidisphaeraceae bacterium]
MVHTHAAARTVSVLLVMFALAPFALAQDAAAPAGGDTQYISLTPAEFSEKAPDLLNKDVEVAGDIQLPSMMSRKSVGTMVDPTSGKVLVQLMAQPGSPALEWLVGGDRQANTHGVFARGKVVTSRYYSFPVLQLTDISKESKVKAAAEKKEQVQAVETKEAAGLAKDVLPPHTNPTGEAAKAWLDRIPTTEASYDRAKSVYQNMQDHANWRGQAEVDDNHALIRGPQRPANFETYYRGLRDTGLSNIFKKFPYQNSHTSWPRVMIVIEEKPRFNGGMPSEFFHNSTKTETDYTWRYRATLWMDATHKIDIAPFNWAFSEMRYNTPYSEVEIWGRTPKHNVPPAPGVEGTAGDPANPVPIATKYPLPDDPAYHRTFHYNTIMVGNLLLDMGFNYNRQDGRVWFVEDIAK